MALTEMQTLILWSLLARTGGAGFQKDIRPEVKKADREALIRAGLIAGAKQGRGLWLEVTDKGWAWAADHLDANLPSRSIHGAAILRAWLTRLKSFMDARGLGLADILSPQAAPEGYVALRARVRRAYLESTGGRFNTRALLTDLRGKLTDIDRATLDDALRKMHLEDDAALSGIDNPKEITPAIHDAGVDFKGVQMYELWIAK